MTYLELLNQLRELSDEQLLQDVTIYFTEQDEYSRLASDYPVGETCVLEEDRLEDNHFYLRVEV